MADPQYWTSEDSRIAIKLNVQLGDHAIVAMASPETTKAIGVFLYDDGTVTILGNHSKEGCLLMLQKAAETLKAVPAIMNLTPSVLPSEPAPNEG